MQSNIEKLAVGQPVWRVIEYSKGRVKDWPWHGSVRAVYEDKDKAMLNAPALIEINEGVIAINDSGKKIVKFQTSVAL